MFSTILRGSKGPPSYHHFFFSLPSQPDDDLVNDDVHRLFSTCSNLFVGCQWAMQQLSRFKADSRKPLGAKLMFSATYFHPARFSMSLSSISQDKKHCPFLIFCSSFFMHFPSAAYLFSLPFLKHCPVVRNAGTNPDSISSSCSTGAKWSSERVCCVALSVLFSW